MIQSRKDYRLYLREDCLVNIKRESCSWFRMKISLWYGLESYMAYNYLRRLRKYEYLLNRGGGIIHRIRLTIAKIRYRRLGIKYRFRINPNVVGYGLRIPHITGGGIIGPDKMGKHCIVNAGVVIGTKTGTIKRPILGDNCEITIGAVVIGNIIIGNNVIIAPNSVVVKDVPDNAVVSGIPAKILSINGQRV